MRQIYAHVVCLAALAATVLGDSATPTATIDAGVVHGMSTSLPAGLGPVNKFLGIPFAQSPPQRFSPPSNVKSFSKALNATEFKPACIQQFACELWHGPLMMPTKRCRSPRKFTAHSATIQQPTCARVRRLSISQRVCSVGSTFW
jgi:hypothetical protein